MTAGPGSREPGAGAHEIVNPPELAPPRGFAHAVRAAAGRTVYLGGQTALDAAGNVTGADLVEQFDVAAGNLAAALRAAGGDPADLVSVQIFTTDLAAYRESLRPIGQAWRRHFGRHYPATALVEVGRLFDVEALVELMGVAVVPQGPAPGG